VLKSPTGADTDHVDYSEAHARLASPTWRIALGGGEAQLGRNVVEQLTWMRSKAATRDTRLPHDFHEVWYALAQELRRLADEHELQMIADLRRKRGRSWQQVAHSLGLHAASRQRLQQRFDRLSTVVLGRERAAGG
jgi:hypothetical protein